MRFADLWEKSRVFRQLFLHKKVFRSVDAVDVAKAEYYWHDRWPKKEFGLCGYQGCSKFCLEGAGCDEHWKYVGHQLPLWKWRAGVLYRYMSVTVKETMVTNRYFGMEVGDKIGSIASKEYVAYHLHMMKSIIGEKVPDDYRVAYIDGNGFNLRPSNLVAISIISGAAVDAGVLRVSDAVVLDNLINSSGKLFMGNKRVKAQWVINIQSISDAIGRKHEYVRQAISRKRFDPGDLGSLVAFCESHKK